MKLPGNVSQNGGPSGRTKGMRDISSDIWGRPFCQEALEITNKSPEEGVGLLV